MPGSFDCAKRRIGSVLLETRKKGGDQQLLKSFRGGKFGYYHLVEKHHDD